MAEPFFPRWRSLLDTLATLLLIAVAGVLLWDRFSGERPLKAAGAPVIKTPSELQSTQSAAMTGSDTARIVIIEYSDFQCQFCAKFSTDILPALSAKYVKTGDVAIAFRNYPLHTIHPQAIDAAIAADCAGRQGKFWDVHDRLFQTQPDAPRWNLPAIVGATGADMDQWRACLAGDGKTRVAADLKQAMALGLSSTPVFLIGVREAKGGVKITDVIVGARPARDFERVLDRLLKG